jgi:hypothetical protein
MQAHRLGRGVVEHGIKPTGFGQRLFPGPTFRRPSVPMAAALNFPVTHNWRKKAAVDVLPFVPVIAAIWGGCTSKKRAAISAKSRRGLSLVTTGTPATKGASVRMAAAPLSIAWPT